MEKLWLTNKETKQLVIAIDLHVRGVAPAEFTAQGKGWPIPGNNVIVLVYEDNQWQWVDIKNYEMQA